MRNRSADLVATLLLMGLGWLFFWRVLTPNPLNQQSLVEGDYSGQFVAFAHYQAERFGAGEVPLWNPYSLGGHPFLADTQSAVFYPPRLITIAILNAGGPLTLSRVYDGLQREMVLHTILASLLMYAFVRCLIVGHPYTIPASLISAITFAYGGYLTGYPQLQLAVMEAGIWLPLALLAFHAASTPNSTTGSTAARRWLWIGVAGIALGLSLLAGHPQTSLLFIYTGLAYFAWRVYRANLSWRVFIFGAVGFGVIGGGLAAVQLLPGLQYLVLTSRGQLSFEAMGNGFPFYDVLQTLLPGVFSLWSPLYFGILGLMLALYAILRRVEGIAFWLALIAVGLALSFGSRTIAYDIFYNLIPGFSLFRGQERSAFPIALATAVLTGLGAAEFLKTVTLQPISRRHVLIFLGIAIPGLLLLTAQLALWIASPESAKQFELVAMAALFGVIGAGALIGIGLRGPDRFGRGGAYPARRNLLPSPGLLPDPNAADDTSNMQSPIRFDLMAWIIMRWRSITLVGLICLELFSVGRLNRNLESVPTRNRLPTPAIVQNLLKIQTAEPGSIWRVDGVRGIRDNYAVAYGLHDIRGISPLKLARVEALLNLADKARTWDLFAVRYVFSDNKELPIASNIIATGDDPYGSINLHALKDPVPWARLMSKTWIETDDNQALGYLSDPGFDMRSTVMLDRDPGIQIDPAATGTVTLISFAPERIVLRASATRAAILNIALVSYPGWEATVDGQPASLLRANYAFTGLAVPPGNHTIQLTYTPTLYYIGAAISLVVLLVTVFGGCIAFFVTVRRARIG